MHRCMGNRNKTCDIATSQSEHLFIAIFPIQIIFQYQIHQQWLRYSESTRSVMKMQGLADFAMVTRVE